MRLICGVLAVMVMTAIFNLIKMGWQKLFFEDKD